MLSFSLWTRGAGGTVDPADHERWVLSVPPWARVAVEVCVAAGAGPAQRRLACVLASLRAFLTLSLFLLLSHADLCCEKHLSGPSFLCRLSWKDKRGSDPLCKIRSSGPARPLPGGGSVHLSSRFSSLQWLRGITH